MSLLVEIDQASQAISTWLEQEVATEYTGVKRWTIQMFSVLIARNGSRAMSNMAPLMKAFNLMTPDDQLDVDEISAVLNSTFDRSGKLTIGSLSYNKPDVTRLVEIMRSFSVSEKKGEDVARPESQNSNTITSSDGSSS